MAKLEMTKPEEKLRRAIESTGIAEVTSSASNEKQDPPPDVKKVIVRSRVQPEDVMRWLNVFDFILQEEEEQDEEETRWFAHCCKDYLRDDGKFGFVWSITVSSRGDLKRPVNDVSRAIRSISANLKSMPSETVPGKAPKRANAVKRATQSVASGHVANSRVDAVLGRRGDSVEVLEMPLVGVTSDRNRPDGPGSKGARHIAGG